MKFAALRSLIINHLSFLILFLFSAFYFLSSATSAHAAAPTITPTQTKSAAVAANTNPDVPNNLHNWTNWTQSVMIEVMSALTCQIAGVDPVNPKQSCLGADQKTGKIGFLPSPQEGGAIGFMGNMIATLYTPPLHTADYFQNLAQNFGISKKTYAQTTGTGFQSLTPLIGIWSAFRNIVYLLLVIVFVVIGLAVMLRVKIDPRTVMTIQNQIPKIIIGILAVTFSFAIAGFLIDMMWVLIYLSFGIISGISKEAAVSVANLNPTLLQKSSVLGMMGDINGMVTGVAWNGGEVIKQILNIAPTIHSFNAFSDISWFQLNILSTFGLSFGNLDIFNHLINIGSVLSSLALSWHILTLPPASGAGTNLGFFQNMPIALPLMIAWYEVVNISARTFLPFLIIFLVVFIAVFIALFRLWFSLLMSYIFILLDVVLAPFWIIGGIIPGSPISLSGWLRDIGANLLAFPATLILLLLGKVFVNAFSTTQNPFLPPLLGDIGPTTNNMLGSLIGIGFILVTPNIVSILKQMLKAPKVDTSSVTQSIAAGAGVPMAGIRSTGAYFARSQQIGARGGWTGTLRNIFKF
ncbi:MAG: hypothetical protein UU14_C0056G0007 [Candidatus Roizmanbacteria bacterium GW2011_GWB1_40_7]|uniref:TrbL/VirB6 plasmid conjugal transfer protein n=1 Tax=Candidatus Roizmanbacteria bacterium GW2011_GWB1_40_7 TaxID=1618482 RepID=A0A0G0VDQ3_9BACT|nr:MAG: hypothetical protein UU14_C0056G0007 [Candidatus Roizmanbacteria bacterium GW2011_GWB1_40_7]